MSNQKNFDLDYEDMDDLHLSDRIEWSEFKDNEVSLDDFDIEPKDYDTDYGQLDFDQKDRH